MTGYLSIAAKLVLNVHDLNNEGSVGQSLDIRQIRMVSESGEPLPEMPAVSGRMMKHWHLEYMTRAELNQAQPKLCSQCRTWEPERKPQDENNGVKACVICDAHGFLCTDKPGFSATVKVVNNDIILNKEEKDNEPEEEFIVVPCSHENASDPKCPTCALRDMNGKKIKLTGEIVEEEGTKSIKISYLQSGKGKTKIELGTSPKGLSLRRSSCINFSWLLPVLSNKSEKGEMYIPTAKQVIHSRVASSAASAEEESSQMIFYKSYASGVYAFVAAVDLGRIGKPLLGEGTTTDQTELKRRQKLAVVSLLPLVIGAFGASQSHALPHVKCLGLLAALSTTEKPIPNLISPIYLRGFEESIALLKSLGNSVSWWTFGESMDGAKNTVQEVFDEILKKI